MQTNLINIHNTNDKKCSRCRSKQALINFGCKANGEEYKTCKRCRGISQPTINDITVSSDIKVIVEKPTEQPLQEPIEEPLQEPIEEKPLLDKLEHIFKHYGYQFGPLSFDMFNNLTDAMDNCYKALHFTEMMSFNMVAAFNRYSDTEINILFCPDDNTLYGINFKDTRLIDSYNMPIKYKSKRRCQICAEKNKKHYRICGQCENQYCDMCFYKANDHNLCCPFCRYTFKTHILKKIKENKIADDKIFSYIFEIDKMS